MNYCFQGINGIEALKKRGVSMTRRSSIPREVGLDHTKDVLREGYQYIPNRKKAFQSDFFESRILGEKRFL